MNLKSRWLALMTTLALAAFVSAGCSPAVGEPIKIGIVTDLSGALMAYGQESVRGFELGIEYATGGTNKVLGRDIVILVEDSAGDPETGRQKALKLIEQDGVHFLQGCASSAVALQIIPLAEQHRILFIVDPAADLRITGADFSPYVFRTGSNVAQDALAGGKYVAENLGETFIFLGPDFAWGHGSAQAWNNVIQAYGGTTLEPVFAPFDCTDFTPYLQRVLDSGADCLVVAWAGAGGAQLFQQIKELGVTDEMNVATGIPDIPGLRALGMSMVGMYGMCKYYHTLPHNEVNDWLVQRYAEKHDGAVPDLFTPGGFAAAVALVKAIETAQSINADDLIPVMEGMSFETPKGTMTFRPEDHQALQSMYFCKLEAVEGFDYPVPVLVEEIGPEECAPPILNQAGQEEGG